MNSVRSLAWLPPSLCGEIGQEAERLLSSWATSLGLPWTGPVECESLASGAVEGDDLVDLRVELPVSWKRALARALIQFDAKGSPVVDAVTERVTLQLQRQLRESFGAAPSASVDPCPLGDRGVRVAVDLLGQRCGFRLSCEQLQAIGRLKRPAPTALPRVNFEQAFADTPVPLVAELGRADVSVEELMQLAAGDVLLLKESLDTPLRVVAPGSALALRAHLGAASDSEQRAMRWLPS